MRRACPRGPRRRSRSSATDGAASGLAPGTGARGRGRRVDRMRARRRSARPRCVPITTARLLINHADREARRAAAAPRRSIERAAPRGRLPARWSAVPRRGTRSSRTMSARAVRARQGLQRWCRTGRCRPNPDALGPASCADHHRRRRDRTTTAPRHRRRHRRTTRSRRRFRLRTRSTRRRRRSEHRADRAELRTQPTVTGRPQGARVEPGQHARGRRRRRRPRSARRPRRDRRG